jgi:cyclic pyranopterin phosphate synthase
VAAAAALRPCPEISLTTNGSGLARPAGPLRDAGLDRINVSLDTLSPETFVTLVRRDPLADVLAGLSANGRRRAGAGQGERGAHARRQRS